jgi:hypothetical protein
MLLLLLVLVLLLVLPLQQLLLSCSNAIVYCSARSYCRSLPKDHIMKHQRPDLGAAGLLDTEEWGRSCSP